MRVSSFTTSDKLIPLERKARRVLPLGVDEEISPITDPTVNPNARYDGDYTLGRYDEQEAIKRNFPVLTQQEEFGVTTPLKRGSLMADQARQLSGALEGDQAAVGNLARTAREMEQLPVSQGARELGEAQTFGQAAGAFIRNPLLAPEVATESLVGQVKTGAPLIAAGAGALSALTGGTAAPLIAVGGNMAAAGVGSYQLSKTEAMLNALRDSGVDVGDSAQVAMALSDPAKREQIKSAGNRYGIPVAIVDALSAGIAGRLFRSVAGKTIPRKLGEGGVELATQMGFGATGEIAGEVASGQDINPASIIAEMFGELGTAPVEITQGLLTKQRPNGGAVTPPAGTPPLAPPAVPPSPSPEAPQGVISPQPSPNIPSEQIASPERPVQSVEPSGDVDIAAIEARARELAGKVRIRRKVTPVAEGEKVTPVEESPVAQVDPRHEYSLTASTIQTAIFKNGFNAKTFVESRGDKQQLYDAASYLLETLKPPTASPEKMRRIKAIQTEARKQGYKIGAPPVESAPPAQAAKSAAPKTEVGKTTYQGGRDAIETQGDLPATTVKDANSVPNFKQDTFYHGTNRSFDNFDPKRIGANETKGSTLTGGRGLYGDGFYFTPEESEASYYGKKTLHVKLNVTNPLVLADNNALDAPSAKRAWESKLSNDYRDHLKSSGSNTDEAWNRIVNDWRNASSPLGVEYARRSMARRAKDFGFDGIYITGDSKGRGREVIVFSPNQITTIKKTESIEPDYLQAPPAPAKAEAPVASNKRTMNVDGDDITIELTPEKAAEFDRLNEGVKKRRAQGMAKVEAQKGWKAPSNPDFGLRSPSEQFGIDSKADAMRIAAEKRALDPRWQTLTEKANAANKEKSNYVGKRVSVDGKLGKITGMSFGNPVVQFDDGTKRKVMGRVDAAPASAPVVAKPATTPKPAPPAPPARPESAQPAKAKEKDKDTEQRPDTPEEIANAEANETLINMFFGGRNERSPVVKRTDSELVGRIESGKIISLQEDNLYPYEVNNAIRSFRKEYDKIPNVLKKSDSEKQAIRKRKELAVDKFSKALNEWANSKREEIKAETSPASEGNDVARAKELAKKALGLSDNLGIVSGLSDSEVIELRGLIVSIAKSKGVKAWEDFKAVVDDFLSKWSKTKRDAFAKAAFKEFKAQAQPEEKETPVSDEGKVGLRQVDNAAFMESIGKAGFEKEEVVEWEESRDRALKNDKVNIEWARDKADALIDDPEGTLYSHEDHAALVMVVHKLQQSRFEARDRAVELRKIGDEVSLRAAEVLDAQVNALQFDEENLRRGGQRGTSNFGRGLQAARMLDNGEEFTRAAIEKKISDETGKALTADQERIAKEQADKIADLDARLKASEDEQAKQRERLAVLEADREIARRKQQARSAGRNVRIEDIDARIEANKAKFKALGREFHSGIFSDAEVKLWAEQIYLYSEKYGIKAVDAADKLITELGDPTVKSGDILSAISAVSEKHKARRKAAAIRYRDKMKAVRELAESINPNNVKEAKKKLRKLKSDYVKADPQDKRLVAVLRQIEKVEDALDRAEIITRNGIKKDADVIEMAREELLELNTRMNLRRREADVNRQIANGKLDTPLLREKTPDGIEVKRDRANLALAKNKLQKIIDSQAKLTTGDKVKGVMQTNRGLVFGLDLMGTMFTRGAEFTTAYPVQSAKIHAKGATGFFTENKAAEYHNEMLSHPATALFLSDDPTYLRDPNGDHTTADELFNNAMLESAAKRKMTRVFGIPIKVLNAGNEASQRAYALGVNGMLDVYAEDYMSRNPYATKAERLEAQRWFKNLMGRGDFQVIDKKTGKPKDGWIEQLIKGGQMIGSAPRILASNIRSPFMTINAMFNFSNRPLQKMAVRQVAMYWGTRAAFISILMALSEAFDLDLEFEINPYSPDFGQIKKGNTRWNVFGPMRSIARTEALLVLAAMPEGANPFAGSAARKAFRSQSPETMILQATVGNRINPPVRLGVGLIFGTDWRGKPASRGKILLQGVTPLWSQNVADYAFDALKNGGSFVDAVGIGVLSHVGQDFNTYPEKKSKPKY